MISISEEKLYEKNKETENTLPLKYLESPNESRIFPIPMEQMQKIKIKEENKFMYLININNSFKLIYHYKK